ncbi:MAG TPA: FKBP-type peptidyl-prolyl cis-trans isomerase, partial [Methylomirabilota bacterium]|nr:FKBP-type peptidyl-prolyl cis-trans isomerase [Methylomirabilota bacterium]
MRITAVCTLALVLATAAPAAAAPELKTDDDKTLYALGLVIARNLDRFTLSEAELQAVQAGLTDGVLHRTPQVELETWGPRI